MKLGVRLKGFSDQAIIEGGVDAERRAQAELTREQRVRVAMTSGRPELPRSELAAAHLSLLEHTPTGEFYAVCRGEQYGETHDRFDAFFVDRNGDPVFLEQPQSGPKSRAELEQQQVAREERRKQPKSRPS